MVKLFHSDKDTSSSDEGASRRGGLSSPPPPLPPRKESRTKPSVLEQQTAQSVQESVPSSEQSASKSSATMRAIEEILSMPAADDSSYKQVAQIAGLAKHPFELHEGGVVRSVDELARACSSMSQDVFSHHVTDQRNDFALWVENSVGDAQLAQRVESTSTPQQLRAVLLDESKQAVKPESREEGNSSQKKPSSSLPSGDLAQRFSELHSNVNDEVESSLKLLADQARRLQALKDEISSSAKSFARQEQALHEVLEQMRSQQEVLEADVQSVEQELERLSTRQSEARSALSKVQKAPEQPTQDPVTSQEPASAPEQPVEEEDPEASANSMMVRSLLAQVRGYVDAGKWPAARKGYQELRDAFYQADDLQGEERKELYNLIHGLYADIHLQSSE